MRGGLILKIIIICLLFSAPASVWGWGFLGHKLINRKAVFALPPELFAFYKRNIEYIEFHSVDPDNRRYVTAEEGPRHFIDFDHYLILGPPDSIPHNWYKAAAKYSEDSLQKHGIVPWHCIFMLGRLTKAFEEHDIKRILKTSAEIGHYLADAHVPLHANSNYNGQFSGQEGIHALWESRIPKLFSDSFDLLTGTVNYLENPTAFIWNVVGRSYQCSDTVFSMEKMASEMHINNKYAVEFNGNNAIETYSTAFCRDYGKLMQGMVERRMKEAIFAVAAFWYTAWVNAGQPDMNAIVHNDNGVQDETELKKKEGQKILGREENGEEP